MGKHVAEAIRQLSAILADYDKAPGQLVHETRLLAAIQRFSRDGSVYRMQANHAIHGEYRGIFDVDGERLKRIAAVARALQRDYMLGALADIEAKVRADVLGDILDIAEDLAPRAPRAAVVLAGGVLEEHIVKLAQTNGVQVTRDDGARKVTQQLNDELAKAGTYDRTEQKRLTWATGLRNDANHDYSKQIGEKDAELFVVTVRHVLEVHTS